MPFSQGAICTHGLKVEGTLQSWPWASAEITVEGLLHVTGSLSDGDHPVIVHARGDVNNQGTIDNSIFIFDGAEDQFVGLGAGMAVPEVRLGLSPVPSVAGGLNLRNMPNPFNPSTEISFSLPQGDEVSLVVYDLAGREVDRLLDEPMTAGDHSIRWSPRNLSSGVYLYRLQVGSTILSRRCLMIK